MVDVRGLVEARGFHHPVGGEFVDDEGVMPLDEHDQYMRGGAGLLIRWSEIRYLDFTEWREPAEAGDTGDRSGDG